MTSPAKLVHFSDVLCVWAYIAQVRMNELATEFGAQVSVEYRFTSVFGAARDKLAKRWKDSGGIAAYSAHVREVAAGFDHVAVHPDGLAVRGCSVVGVEFFDANATDLATPARRLAASGLAARPDDAVEN